MNIDVPRRVFPCVGGMRNRVYADRPRRQETARVLREAELYVQRAGYGEAIERARGILREDPTHLGALELLARAQWKAGLHAPLLDTLRTLVALNPYEPGYHALRGSTLQCLGRYGEAVEAFDRARGLPEAASSSEALQVWQAELVATLAKQDPVFRAHLEQSPRAACAARGFRMAGHSPALPITAPNDRLHTHRRPS